MYGIFKWLTIFAFSNPSQPIFQVQGRAACWAGAWECQRLEAGQMERQTRFLPSSLLFLSLTPTHWAYPAATLPWWWPELLPLLHTVSGSGFLLLLGWRDPGKNNSNWETACETSSCNDHTLHLMPATSLLAMGILQQGGHFPLSAKASLERTSSSLQSLESLRKTSPG